LLPAVRFQLDGLNKDFNALNKQIATVRKVGLPGMVCRSRCCSTGRAAVLVAAAAVEDSRNHHGRWKPTAKLAGLRHLWLHGTSMGIGESPAITVSATASAMAACRPHGLSLCDQLPVSVVVHHLWEQLVPADIVIV
jgi:hypothetical protein